MKKIGPTLSFSLVALAAVLILLFGGQERPAEASYQEIAQSLDATYTVTLPIVLRNYDAAYVSPFGVVMYGGVNEASGLLVMQNAGARRVTTQLKWSAIEPSKGSYDWSAFDAKAQNAADAGMDLFVLFTGNPSWAAELPGGPVYDMQDLLDFVTVMAERYDCDGVNDADGHPCVHSWSFYAEPDNGDLFRAELGKGYWGHDGAGYADMISQVSTAMKVANPRAQVLIGGLAYDYFEEEGGPFVRSFLADTLAALNALGGAGQYVDAVAFHYYPISADWTSIREKAAEIRGIMTANGAGALPLLCPEMSYWSSPTFDSSATEQAWRLVQMYTRGLSAGLQEMSWYQVFDDAVAGSVDDEYPDDTSGLLDVYGAAKPSYYAYQTLTRELRGLYYQRELQFEGAEGYVFGRAGRSDKTVLWSQAGTTFVTFPYTRLRLVDTLGGEFIIVDNQPTSPGDWDSVVGQITLAISEQPFYVEPK
jgi:hypothetical protein